jgi:hypothetical protein
VYIIREKELTTTDDDPEVTRTSSPAPDNDANNLASEEAFHGIDGMRSSGDPDTGFDGVMSFREFSIAIDGIDHDFFPDCQRMTYYKLCRERKALLHRHLIKNISPTLVAAVIMRTISISEGIRAFSFASSCSREDLTDWKKTLEGLELMGMDVAFLRQSVDDLLSLLAARSHPCSTTAKKRPSSRRAVPR